MLAASFPRRAAGLLAAGAVGLSVAVLGAPGIAQAAYDIDVTGAVDRTVTIPSNVCAVRWNIGGGRGGHTFATGGFVIGTGGQGLYFEVTTSVVPGSTLMIQPGQLGQAVAWPSTDVGAGGTSGTRPSGGSGGAGGAGGGGASIVRSGATVDSPILLVAAGGGGAGSKAYGGDALDAQGGGVYPLVPGNSSGPAIAGGTGGRADGPGAGGAPMNGATGVTLGQAGSALLGGSGPAGAGGGGGGVYGGGSGGSDGTDGSGGGAGMKFSKDVQPTDEDYQDFNMNGAGYVRGTYIPCAPAATATTTTTPAPVPAPATVPTADGPLSTPQGAISSVTAGRQITLTGSGYKPNSDVDLYVYSTPQKIGSVRTDSAGNFSVAVTLPAGLAAGAHHLVATGVNSLGAPRFLRMDVTVRAAGKLLAGTGVDPGPVLVVGSALVAAGGALLVVTRRRRTAA